MSHVKALVACPCCESALIQIESWEPFGRDGMLLDRFCPECGHNDELALERAVGDLLCVHAAELAASLEELADRLAAASELRFDSQ